jgi:DNA-3-methyladenine glycosylase I
VYSGTDPLYTIYHDTEWGVPLHDDRKLFESHCLTGRSGRPQSADSSKKTGNYLVGPLIISIHTVSAVTIPEKGTQLPANKGIIRNKLKINSAISNAAVFLKIQKRFGSFDTYLRRFVGGKPIRNAWSEVLRIIFG